MKRKEMKDDLMAVINQNVVKVFVFAMILVFPLFYHDNYIDIERTKLAFFKITSITVTGLTAYSGIIRIVKSRFRYRGEKLHFSVTDVCAVCFAAVILVSCLLCSDSGESFWGTTGRRMGGLVFLLCIAVYFIVSRYYMYSNSVLWFFLLGNGAVWILQILNFWELDPLQMNQNLNMTQHGYFISTIGNINIAAGYGGVILAVCMVLYYLSENKLSRKIYFGTILVGTYACYGTKSQSWILSVGAALMVLLWDAAKERERFCKFLKISWAFWLASAMMSLCVKIMEYSGWAQGTMNDLKEQIISNLLITKEMLVIELFLLFGIAVIGRKCEMHWLPRIRNIFFSVFGIGLVVLIVTAVAVNMTNLAGNWQKYFELQDSFGSGRGFIWKRTIEAYGQQPFVQKLFGCGPNYFKQFIDQNYGTEIRIFFNAALLDAHNEGLQFLVTTGIFGVISYFGMQISAVVRCMVKRKDNSILLAGAVGIAAYIGQGMVSNPQVFLTPMLFLFLGMLESGLRKNN